MLSIVISGSYFGSDSEEQSLVSRSNDYAPVASLDEVAAADIAATIARDADLLVANNVRNKADSLTAITEFTVAEGSYLSKPQVVASDAKTNKDIREYTAQEGDTVDTVARRFNVTTNTIKWANNLSGDFLSAGKKLTIPPVTGLIYEVKSGETARVLAGRFNANEAQILAFNDAEIDGLKPGDKIIIPDGEEPAPVEAPVFIAVGPRAVESTTFSFGGDQPLYGGNGYTAGYCTWHAANRRLQLGLPMPRNLGNAVTWSTLGARAGMSVTEAPVAGAILWHKNSYSLAGGLGHVGFVEAVNPDGSILVSDMNFPVWNVMTTRTISQADTSGYLFIN